MPNIEHIADSSISSILDNDIKTPYINGNEHSERYFTLKHRKYNVTAEYLENERTPIHKTYKTLILVPKLPRDDFHIRYGNESRVHQFLSNNLNKITRRIVIDQTILQRTLVILHRPFLRRSIRHRPLLLTLLKTPILQRPILHLFHLLHSLHPNILNLLLLQFLFPRHLYTPMPTSISQPSPGKEEM